MGTDIVEGFWKREDLEAQEIKEIVKIVLLIEKLLKGFTKAAHKCSEIVSTNTNHSGVVVVPEILGER